MAIYKLSPQSVEDFAKHPEVGMGVQVGILSNGLVFVVAGSRIAILFDESLSDELAPLERLSADFKTAAPTVNGVAVSTWVNSLKELQSLRPVVVHDAYQMLAFIPLGPRFPIPPAPSRPSYVHGHLPFHGICSGTDVFYRYEQFPTSHRVDVKNHAVTKPDTYAAPESEEQFTPTGLSAVGRFALPSLLPACWRYKLTPAAGTEFYYGASVPLYGQSGGAVEVMFPKPFKNNGPIPKVDVLPIL